MAIEIEGVRYDWSQPVCEHCWWDQNDREPYRLKTPELEHCCYCGGATLSGIYRRVDPRTVPYPTPEPEETAESEVPQGWGDATP